MNLWDFGIYIWNDLSKYMGQWDENKISGIGVYSWLDGRMYNGEWKEDKLHWQVIRVQTNIHFCEFNI